MAQLRQDYRLFQQRDVEIVVVGPEKPAAFADYWHAQALPFVGLPDPAHSVLKLFGQEVNLFKLGRMPAQVLVDTSGVVRFAYYGHSMSDIPGTAEVIAAVDALAGPVAELSGLSRP